MSNLNRRDFMKVLGTVSVASGCDVVEKFGVKGPMVPLEQALPYVVTPEQVVPGVATWFRTGCEACSAGCGVNARTREGRVVKLEGNRQHPTNAGALCARGQAALQAPYSPDRFGGPLDNNSDVDWDTAITTASGAISKSRAGGGGIAWVGRPRTGSLGALVSQFTGAIGATRLFWEPLGLESLRAASKTVFGRDTIPTYHLADAHTVLSFGADFLHTWLSPMAQARGFAQARDPHHGDFTAELVCIEPRIGNTSANADLHLKPVPGTEAAVAMAIAKLAVSKNSYAGPAASLAAKVKVDEIATRSGIAREKLQMVADKLNAAPSVVLPGGEATSAGATDLAIATLVLNEILGNVGKSVRFGDEHNVRHNATYREVADLMRRCAEGAVDVLFIDDLDLVHALPPQVGVAAALAKVGRLVVFADEPTDTLGENTLVLPPGSTLENWGDSHAVVGRHTLHQPVMTPLKNTKSVGDVLLAIAKAGTLTAPALETPPNAATDAEPEDGNPQIILAPGFEVDNYLTYLKQWWEVTVRPMAAPEMAADAFWTQSVQNGGAFYTVSVAPQFGLTTAPSTATAEIGGSGSFHLALFPHPFLLDGRHANRPWAQEVPEPISTYTWSSWAEIHPRVAKKLGLADTDKVRVSTEQGEVEVAWFGSPGIREDTIALVMGNGHEQSGRYTRYGANPVKLLPSSMDPASGALRYVATKAELSRAGSKREVLPTAGSLTQEHRPINYAVMAKNRNDGHGPGSLVHLHGPPVDDRLLEAGVVDMFPEPEHPTYRFAMAIDLNSCTGCGACETACYAENNLPVVGPDQINISRLMGWIRLSRYWEGEGDHPDIRWQPVMCQHCAHAPCEAVCPVLATYHNLDGLNAMIYNRCVGTRYCGNNCPYSARRFNYHSYDWPDSFYMMLNPDVMVREMGVMEKCTFCIQRIRAVKDTYRDEGQTAPDDALVKLTACASACPSHAITFGNLKEEGSEVKKKFDDPRSFHMLSELNTKPGVKYLARLVHHELASHGGGHGAPAGDHGGGHADDGHKPSGDNGAKSHSEAH